MTNKKVDVMGKPITGEVIDILTNIKTGEVTVLESHNLIVDACSTLLAALMKGEENIVGITYWENGSGLAAWDTTLPDPEASDVALTTPLYRKAITAEDIVYLTPQNTESPTRTSKIQITVSFSSLESNGDLREFAIWGGNATASLGTGIMIDRKTHGLITKNSEITLTRILRLQF